MQLRPSTTRRDESIAAAVWADQAAFLVVLAALFAVTLGWIQMLAADREPGPVAVNVALGLLIAWAAAAVRGWAGLDTHLAALRRIRLAHLEEKLVEFKEGRRLSGHFTAPRYARLYWASVPAHRRWCAQYSRIATSPPPAMCSGGAC